MFFLLFILDKIRKSYNIKEKRWVIFMNPILKREFFVPDPEGHVMPDRRLYLYGSLDISGNQGYCSKYQRVFSTDDPNLENWTDHGICFENTKEHPAVSWAPDMRLSAPDCIHKDGKYYMFLCSSINQMEAVSVADNPAGPFEKAEPVGYANGDGIDPAVFVDDDGKAYLFWGQFNLRGGQLNDDMHSLIESTVCRHILTDAEHGFHEGACIRKRKGIYYLIFADITRGKPTCLSYAMSDKPLGPYTKKGVIIDNINCDPNVWNNHGSIEEFKGQWYVFYHRSSQNGRYSRRACAEKIYFNEDGTIDEVEMTSQGASDPIDAFGKIDASVACRVRGNGYIAPDPNGLNGEILTSCGGGNFWAEDWAEYKYLAFGNGANAAEFFIRGSGEAAVMTENGERLGEIKIDSKEFSAVKMPLKEIAGVKPIWLLFRGKGIDVVWFRFQKIEK